ncbi:hypothetical protein BTVI_48776 [Pitangus sulphuratus]|nr:hypothetical protein BTVI_48776 [Pitangus sulphuratus]
MVLKMWQSDYISRQSRVRHVTYLDFCKAFAWSPKTIFSLNWRGGFDGTVREKRNQLDGHIQGFVVSGSECQWSSVTSVVPQGSIWALLFISEDGIDKGIHCILSKFGDDTKLRGAADPSAGRDAFQAEHSSSKYCNQYRMKRCKEKSLLSFASPVRKRDDLCVSRKMKDMVYACMKRFLDTRHSYNNFP